MEQNIQLLILKVHYYNSTIMSKAKNIKHKVIQDSDEASDSPLPVVAQKPAKKQQLQAKKATKNPPKPQSDQEEEDTPIVEKKPQKQIKTQAPVAKKAVQPIKKVVKQESSEEQSEEQAPKKVIKAKSPVQKALVPAKKIVKKQSSEEEESQEQQPKKVVKAKSPVQKPIVTKKKVQESSQQQESEEVVPVKAKASKPAPKAVSPALKAKSPVQKPLATKKAAKPETSSEEESEEVAPVKTLQKVKSPVQKVLPTKKPVTKAPSSDEQSQEEKPVKKVVAPVKGKAAKKIEQSQEEEEELLPAPKNGKKVEAPKQHVPAEIDEEGEFQICVKGLSFQAYQNDVEELFNPFGNVLSVRLLLRDDGKSRGLAFVKFSSKASFNKALELNGTQQFGRPITVEQSLGKQNNGGFQKGGNFGNNNKSFGNNQSKYPTGGANIETPTLFVGGLSYNSTQQSLAAYFSQAGEVSNTRIVTDKETGKPRGFGYVEFYDVDTAKKAYETLNNGQLDGRQIRLDSATQRDRPQGGFGGGGFGGGFGGQAGGRGAPRSTSVNLTQDDKNAKKGSITQFQGKIVSL